MTNIIIVVTVLLVIFCIFALLACAVAPLWEKDEACNPKTGDDDYEKS